MMHIPLDCVYMCVLVAQLCLTLCNPMDYCSPPGSSVHGILQARILEWVAIPFSGRLYHCLIYQFSSVAHLCLTLCNPLDCSTPHFPVHHQLPELTQTHVHQVGDDGIISSSVVPFSSCLQSFPTSGSFPISQFFASGSQSFGASASVSVLPMNIQDWFPLELTNCLIYR